MMTADQPRFFHALAAMGLLFSDELTKPRQQLYWEILQDHVTIDEWEYACAEAMGRETFHKIPVPGQLLEYVKEYRRAQREIRLQAQCAEGVRTRKRLLEIRESLVDPAEVDALIASVWPEEHTVPKPLFPRRRVRRSEEELHYEPHGDAEAAKRKAREQLRQIMEDDARHQDAEATRARLEALQRECAAAIKALDARDHARDDGHAAQP
jgi:ribosomal 50S subunit-associated protein YjgA (DUF615 family)